MDNPQKTKTRGKNEKVNQSIKSSPPDTCIQLKQRSKDKKLARKEKSFIEENNSMKPRPGKKRKSTEKNDLLVRNEKLPRVESEIKRTKTLIKPHSARNLTVSPNLPEESQQRKVKVSKPASSQEEIKGKEKKQRKPVNTNKILEHNKESGKLVDIKNMKSCMTNVKKRKVPSNDEHISSTSEPLLYSATSNLGTASVVKKVKSSASNQSKADKRGKESPTERSKGIKPVKSATTAKTKTSSTKKCKSKQIIHKSPEKVISTENIPQLSANDPMALLMMMEGRQNTNVTTCPQDSTAAEESSSDSMEEDNSESGDSDDSDELSDWEDVKDYILPVEEVRSQVPSKPVEITLEMPDIFKKKRKKKEFDWGEYLKKRVRKFKKEVAINIHKGHILCLIALGLRQNSVLNNEVLQGLALSLVPQQLTVATSVNTERIVDAAMSWYRKKYPLDQVSCSSSTILIMVDSFVKALSKSSIVDARMWVYAFVVILRTLGLSVRLVLSLQPIPFKGGTEDSSSSSKSKASGSSKVHSKAKNRTSSSQPSSASKPTSAKPSTSSFTNKSCSSSSATCKSSSKTQPTLPSPQRAPSSRRSSHEARVKSKKNLKEDSEEEFSEEDEDEMSEEEVKKKKPLKKGKARCSAKQTQPDVEEFENSESEFEETSPYFRRPYKLKIQSNRKILSDDDEGASSNANVHDFWLEVFLKEKKKWTCYDCFKNVFGKPYIQECRASQPLSYVVAFRNDNGVRDVTPRYAKQWFSQTRKNRVDADWLEQTFTLFSKATYNEQVMEEDEIKSQLMVRPMPSSIGEFKNHPLYALRRHLLKFEAIYPDTAIPMGYIRKEPIYARECVRTLHSRHNWLKEGRLVRLKEEPYKMVKSRPKWNQPKANPEELDLELYGEWQTEKYIPPPAYNGKVPKNEYGNVELFKPWMLPTGTVQLKVQGLQRVAKKLNIDVAPAMVGWDYHGGHPHPMFDGFVVCEEYADSLLTAWDEDQEIQKQKEDEKREKRVYGNWRLLIRGVLIKERLKNKFLQEAPLMDFEEKKEGEICNAIDKTGRSECSSNDNHPTSSIYMTRKESDLEGQDTYNKKTKQSGNNCTAVSVSNVCQSVDASARKVEDLSIVVKEERDSQKDEVVVEVEESDQDDFESVPRSVVNEKKSKMAGIAKGENVRKDVKGRGKKTRQSGVGERKETRNTKKIVTDKIEDNITGEILEETDKGTQIILLTKPRLRGRRKNQRLGTE